MDSVSLDDPAWQTTFPHLVSPLDDEWLPGLLLRCDEANHWGSRATLAHLLRPGPEKFHRCWRTETPNLAVIARRSLNLDYLAQLLALPKSTLLATTYHAELTRIYGGSRLIPNHLNPSFSFHLCPACVAEARLLRRSLALAHLTLCPEHQVTLLNICQCGPALRLFHRQACPFSCHICDLDWADLPKIEAAPERLVWEQKLLSWYAFFFSKGDIVLLWRAIGLINRIPLEKPEKSLVPLEKWSKLLNVFSKEELPLGSLVALLMERDLSPSDLRTDETPSLPQSEVSTINTSSLLPDESENTLL
jgi:TniQ